MHKRYICVSPVLWQCTCLNRIIKNESQRKGKVGTETKNVNTDLVWAIGPVSLNAEELLPNDV